MDETWITPAQGRQHRDPGACGMSADFADLAVGTQVQYAGPGWLGREGRIIAMIDNPTTPYEVIVDFGWPEPVGCLSSQLTILPAEDVPPSDDGANARMRQVAELRVGTWRDTAARLEGERDRARGTAATLEAENARMVEWNAITTRAFETTRRVLQEASGLPDDIDDPDCRDEMVLALRPRAEKAEAEVARLREGIEALATEMQSDSCPACHASYADEGSTTWGCDHTEGMQHAGDMLRALLAEGGE